MKLHSTSYPAKRDQLCWLLSTVAIALCAMPVLAAKYTPAVITLSDRTVITGRIRLIGVRPLTMVPDGENRQHKFHLADIVSIDHFPENASMEKPWVFKESGRAEKVYLEGEYPLINFKTRLSLVNGKQVTGHIISVGLYFKSEQGKRKVFLKRQIKGGKTQKLDDVVYIRNIRMTSNQVEGGGNISGDVRGFGHVMSVSALDNAREQVIFAEVSEDGGFDFGTVLPGSYDICVLTATHVLLGLSDETSVNRRGDSLQKGDIEGVRKKFPLADDFFNDRWVLRLNGNRKFAKALVYKRRADYYESERWTPGGFLWHLEVWSWHLAGDEWKLDRRSILIRHKQKGGEQNRKLYIATALNAVHPGGNLHIEGGRNNEKRTFIRDLE
ncbi:MAG: hypothetical protein R6V06_05500 [Kiritimatiellia bacterium]